MLPRSPRARVNPSFVSGMYARKNSKHQGPDKHLNYELLNTDASDIFSDDAEVSKSDKQITKTTMI